MEGLRPRSSERRYFVLREAGRVSPARVVSKSSQMCDLAFVFVLLIAQFLGNYLFVAIDSAPFELSEQGWGEFDIVISIQFKDPSEKPIDVTHTLRLFPPEGIPWPDNKPIVSENLDAIVFNDPNEWFYNELVKFAPEDGPPIITPYISPTAEEDAHLEKIIASQKKIRDEIWKLKEKYIQTASQATKLRRKIDLQEAAVRANALSANGQPT